MSTMVKCGKSLPGVLVNNGEGLVLGAHGTSIVCYRYLPIVTMLCVVYPAAYVLGKGD